MSVRLGFVIGFLLAAIFGGAWAWREGLLTPAAERHAQASGEVPNQSSPPSAGETSPSGPNAAPTPRPTPPSASPTPPATPPHATPPNSAPPATNPPPAASAPPPQGATASASVDGRKGAFDVVRVEPSGEAVVAGRCAADCTAELTSNGRVIDTAKADAGGSFAMTPPTLAPGDHQLGLTVTAPDGAKTTSEQTVTVSVPRAPSKDVVVVLNEPDAPSKVLQQPGQAPAAAAPEGERVAARPDAAAPAVESVSALSLGAIDAENGRFFVQGTAPAGSKLRIYLNNTLVSEATAGADGRWSLRVERGLSPGKYTARVDHVGPDGKVAKRAEASFDLEPEIAAAPAQAPASSAPPAAGETAGTPAQAGATPSAQAQRDAAAAERPSSGSDAAQAKPSEQAARAEGGAGSAGEAPRSGQQSDATEAPKAPGAAPSTEAPKTAEAATSPDASDAPHSAGTPGAPRSAERSAGAPAADPANPVVASIDTAQVKRGDSLWRISRATYGHGRRYTVIFNANDRQIRDPNLIYPGQVLVLPTEGADASADRKR